jgi:hypothetical protein
MGNWGWGQSARADTRLLPARKWMCIYRAGLLVRGAISHALIH